MTQITQSNPYGIGLFSLGIFFQTVLDATAKWLTGSYAVPEIIYFRSLFAIIPIMLLIRFMGGVNALRVTRPGLHLLRGILVIITITGFYVSLSYMSLPDAESVFFTAPLFMTIFSFFFLNEMVGRKQWFLIMLGFAGATLILQPQSVALGLVSLLPLFAAVTYALVMIVTRHLLASDTALSVIVSGNLIVLLISTLALNWFWSPPTLHDILLFLFMGLIDGASVLCLTLALKQTPVSVLAPYEYTMLIWALIFSFIFWGELPSIISWIGMLTIVCVGLISNRAERKVKYSP